jgi:hypothetical protein
MGMVGNILYASPVETAVRAGPVRSEAGLIAPTSLFVTFTQCVLISSSTDETGSAGPTNHNTHT